MNRQWIAVYTLKQKPGQYRENLWKAKIKLNTNYSIIYIIYTFHSLWNIFHSMKIVLWVWNDYPLVYFFATKYSFRYVLLSKFALKFVVHEPDKKSSAITQPEKRYHSWLHSRVASTTIEFNFRKCCNNRLISWLFWSWSGQ